MFAMKDLQLHEYEQPPNDDEECSSLLMSIVNRNWNHVKSILQSNDFLAKIRQEDILKAPVLHVACSVGEVPTEIIDLLLHAYGNECCNAQDEDGNLAIHKACSTPGVSMNTIRKLFLISPKTSFARAEFDGEIPFELLLRQGKNGLQVLNAILEDLPKSCFIAEDRGTTIFHELHSECLPESIMIRILERYPDIALFQDTTHGNSIAHMICSQRHGTASMLQALMRVNQCLASAQDHYGNLPLHVVNSRDHSEEMIQILLETFPEGAMHVNNDMETPFSTKLIRFSPKKIRALVKHLTPSLRMKSLRTRNTAGMLPIEVSFYYIQHSLSAACHNNQNEITTTELNKIVQNNHHLKEMIESMMLILQATCYDENKQYHHRDESFWLSFPLVTKLLIQEYPQLLEQCDCNGNLPLHLVAKSEMMAKQSIVCKCCHKDVNDGIYFWLNQNHQQCTQCNRKWKKENVTRQVPLIGYQGSQILKDIMRAHPESVTTCDAEGNLPLHLSLLSGKSWCDDGIKELLMMSPETISMRDKDGAPPALLAAGRCDLTTIFLMIRKNPGCTSI